MLGTSILESLSSEYALVATDLETGLRKKGIRWHKFNLLDTSHLETWLENERPDAVVHCAAIVNVDACQKNPHLSKSLHVNTTEMISNKLLNWGGRLIYISSDSVFDGLKNGAYLEDDKPKPLNVYAQTKLEGEHFALASPLGTVIRTNIFGWSGPGRMSFAEWVFKGLTQRERMTMFHDVIFNPIHVSHLAAVIGRILSGNISGLYHATGSTTLSKYDFALSMAAIFELKTDLILATSIDDANLDAIRPKNMYLSNRKLSDVLGYRLPGAEEGLALFKKQKDSGWADRIKGIETDGENIF